MEELTQSGVDRFWKGGFGKSAIHDFYPAIAGRLGDLKRGVTHAEPGVATSFKISHRATEAEDEEVTHTFFGTGQIVLGVHGSQDVV